MIIADKYHNNLPQLTPSLTCTSSAHTSVKDPCLKNSFLLILSADHSVYSEYALWNLIGTWIVKAAVLLHEFLITWPIRIIVLQAQTDSCYMTICAGE